MLLDFLIFAYIVSVLEALVSAMSLCYRFRLLDKRRKLPLLILICFIPGFNCYLTWKFFTCYQDIKDSDFSDLAKEIKKKLARVNHGKGVKLCP